MLMLMVNVKVKPGRREEFLAAIKEDASSTSEKEEGNFQFTVIQDNDDPDAFFFLEVFYKRSDVFAFWPIPYSFFMLQ